MNLQKQFENEIKELLTDITKVEGKDFYKTLTQEGVLCGLTQWVRILREVKELNAEFHTLRTYMGAVSGILGVLHFLIYPADGAFADKPLCGRVLIPNTYPRNPPVVHLLTKTGRSNVDVYSCYTQQNMLKHMHSSMCFDVLRSEENGGKWRQEYTLSCLMASLIQSIVSMKVPQEYGGEIDEFVTMEKLDYSNKAVATALQQFGSVMPPTQTIKKIEAAPVKAKVLDMPNTIESFKDDKSSYIYSEPIKLQPLEKDRKSKVYTIGFDLSELKNNPSTVFSIILTNDPDDERGKKTNTVIVRNGVTATAAKKVKRGQLNWFYHGKPMNQSNLKLIVTIGYDQFCISYLEKDRVIVHGDCPVSFLTPAEIGSVWREDFYLTIMMKNKNKGQTVKVKTFKPDFGYLHPIFGGITEIISDTKHTPKIEETKTEEPTETAQPNWSSLKTKAKKPLSENVEAKQEAVKQSAPVSNGWKSREAPQPEVKAVETSTQNKVEPEVSSKPKVEARKEEPQQAKENKNPGPSNSGWDQPLRKRTQVSSKAR